MTAGNRNGFVNRNIPYNNNNRARPFNGSPNNNGQIQNRGYLNNYQSQMNTMNNNQGQNRNNYPTQQYQQQGANRNRSDGPNNNLRMVNVEDDGENLGQDQACCQENMDNLFMDFPDQHEQDMGFQELDSGN